MNKLITLKDGHTMYADNFRGMTERIINGCISCGMPVDHAHTKFHGDHDMSIHVENFDATQFRHLMNRQRYSSTVQKEGTKSIVNINFY